MIDPYRGVSEKVQEEVKSGSYERMRIELVKSIEHLLRDFEMTWDGLAEQLRWIGPDTKTLMGGDSLHNTIANKGLSLSHLNEIAHCFSAEAYIILRPRFPYTHI